MAAHSAQPATPKPPAPQPQGKTPREAPAKPVLFRDLASI